MDQQARLKASVDIVYRNAPARLKMQLLRGKPLTPTEEEMLRAERQKDKLGPMSMAGRMKMRSRGPL